ncbi:MAG: hypothetical protein ACYDDF_14135 [Thermoplasmatota archaeon]
MALDPLTQLVVAIVGLPLIFFLPGFFAVRAIAPRRRDPVGTILMSIVASVSFTVLLGSALGFGGLFQLAPLLATLGGAAIILGLIAFQRGGLRRGIEEPPVPRGGALLQAASEARARKDSAAAQAAERELDGMRRRGES